MRTYTFKIKVSSEKVVAAVHMQLEQFYDSVKLTNFDELAKKFPSAYITVSDYYVSDDKNSPFETSDRYVCRLRVLTKSKDLKSWLCDPDNCSIPMIDDDVELKQKREKFLKAVEEMYSHDQSAEK